MKLTKGLLDLHPIYHWLGGLSPLGQIVVGLAVLVAGVAFAFAAPIYASWAVLVPLMVGTVLALGQLLGIAGLVYLGLRLHGFWQVLVLVAAAAWLIHYSVVQPDRWALRARQEIRRRRNERLRRLADWLPQGLRRLYAAKRTATRAKVLQTGLGLHAAAFSGAATDNYQLTKGSAGQPPTLTKSDAGK